MGRRQFTAEFKTKIVLEMRLNINPCKWKQPPYKTKMEVMKRRQSKNILTEKEMELVSLLMQDCQSTGDIQSKLKRLFAGTIEQMLEAEMDEHLGYEKHSIEGNNTGNSRNGYNHKTIISFIVGLGAGQP